jgi:hypothetical protein
MGQAAGNAAALALTEEKNPRCVDITLLRENLLKQGAILTPPLHSMKRGEKVKEVI